jgi:hypothetical protein
MQKSLKLVIIELSASRTEEAGSRCRHSRHIRRNELGYSSTTESGTTTATTGTEPE